MGSASTGSATTVRLTWEDGQEDTCTLDEFLRSNAETLDDEEIQALRAGDRVAIGGGAQPLVYVEIVTEKWDVADALVRTSMTREEAAAWFLFGSEAA